MPAWKPLVGCDFLFLLKTSMIESFPFNLFFRVICGNKNAPRCAYLKWVQGKWGLGMPRLRHLWQGEKCITHPESRAWSHVWEAGGWGEGEAAWGLQPGDLGEWAQQVSELPLPRGVYPEKPSRLLNRCVDSTVEAWARCLCSACWGGTGRRANRGVPKIAMIKAPLYPRALSHEQKWQQQKKNKLPELAFCQALFIGQSLKPASLLFSNIWEIRLPPMA